MNNVRNSKTPEVQTIKTDLSSPDSDARLRALLHIRQTIESGGQQNELFELAKNHITDSDNDCRWQSIIIIGQFLDIRQQDIWEIILRFGSSNDSDMRTAIATILLEHFFEHNPDSFDKRFMDLKEEIHKGNKNLLDTLSLCRFHIKDSKHNGQLSELLRTK
jgi:hypothetical protein